MPGNEVGERVRNFFEQENPSQGQHPFQATEGNWPVLNTGSWSGSQRQDVNNYTIQHSVAQRGYIHGSTQSSYGADHANSAGIPEFYPNQVPNLNGLMHAPQVFLTRQHDRSVLGVDAGSDRNCLVSNMQFSGMHEENNVHHNKRTYQMGASESPVNFDFFGGQKPIMNVQQSCEMPLPRQPSVFSDMQLVQQQILFKQMQEFRQQQIHQIERQQSSLNQPTFLKQIPGALPNSFAYPLSSELILGNANGMQLGPSVGMQGSSTGLIFSSDLGQVPLSGSLIHQQVDQSFYGVPVTSAIPALSQYSHVQIDGPVVQQFPKHNDSISSNQVSDLHNQFNIQGRVSSQQEFQGKNRSEFSSIQGIVNGVIFDNPIQVEQENNDSNSRIHTLHRLASTSETLPTNLARNVTSSQSFPALDPTEEKILFGSDDNIWDAFGKDIVSDSTVVSNSFSSIQCGTWSALMQSAVREASGSKMGLQEGSSGLNQQNRNPKYLGFSGSEDRVVWSENNMQTGSQLGYKFPDDPPAIFNGGIAQHQQSEFMPRTHIEMMQHCSSIRPPSKYAEASMLPNQNDSERQFEDAHRIYGNPLPLSQVDTTMKGLQGPWMQQHPSTLYGSNSQLCNVSIDWKTANSSTPCQNTNVINMEIEGSLTSSGRGVQRNTRNVEQDPPGPIKASSHVHYSNPDATHLNAADERLRGSSSTRNKEIQSVQKLQQLKMDSPSANSSADDHTLGTCEMHNHNKKDGGCSESSFSSIICGELKENVWLDANDSHASVVSKSNSSLRTVQKNRSLPRFQYHPMGISDVDPHFYETGHITQVHKQQVPQISRNSEHRSFLKSHPVSSELNVSSREKEHSPCLPEVKAGFGKLPSFSQGGPPDCGPSRPAAADGLMNMNVTSRNAYSSQSMLDLLHKVDRQRDNRNFACFSKSYSGTVADVYGGSAGHLKQSPSSQGFGLQLAPPSQKFSASSQGPNTMISKQVSSGHGVSFHTRPVSSSFQSLPYSRSCTSVKTPANTSVGKSEFPCSKGFTQGLAVTSAKKGGSESVETAVDCASGFRTTDESCSRDITSQSISSPGMTSCAWQDKKDFLVDHTQQSNSGPCAGSWKNAMLDAGSVSQHYATSNVPQKGTSTAVLLNSWSCLPPQPHSDLSNLLKSHFHPSQSSVGMTKDNVCRDGSDRSRAGSLRVKSKEMVPMSEEMNGQSLCSSQYNKPVDNAANISPCTSFATSGDILSFNHTLKHNNTQEHNYSLPKLQNLKGVDVVQVKDAFRSTGNLKIMESSEAEKQLHYGHEKGAQSDYSLAQPPESKKLKLFHETEGRHDKNPAYANVLQEDHSQRSQCYNRSSNCIPTTIRAEQPRVSPQMAPSWFGQYGTFKHKEGIPINDALGNANAENICGGLVVGNSLSISEARNSVDDCSGSAEIRITNFKCQNLDTVSIGCEPSHLPVPDIVASQNPVIARPKKRKTDTSGLIPWHKELTCSRVLHAISAAETDWARKLNRLVEKMLGENEINDNGTSVFKPKRRLIMATQFMQQLFRPPPKFVLSVDAISSSEDVVCFVARLALGDACCLTSHPAIVTSLGSKNRENSKSSNQTGDESISELAEELNIRLRNLEKDSCELDAKVSILDIRMECEDLERFSIINRFARFHGRGQIEGAETSSSESKTTYQRFYLQRYVTALPMPGNLPENVQCLSL